MTLSGLIKEKRLSKIWMVRAIMDHCMFSGYNYDGGDIAMPIKKDELYYSFLVEDKTVYIINVMDKTFCPLTQDCARRVFTCTERSTTTLF